MAEPILFDPPLRNRRHELLQQLERAPEEHVEALLDLYSILQLLRDKGLLEVAKGALGSGEKILSIVTETIEQDEVVRTVRNLVILLKVLGSIEPEALEKIVHSAGLAAEHAKVTKPPGIFKLLGSLAKPSSRRIAAPLVASLEAAGEYLNEAPRNKTEHPKTTRHYAES